MRHEQRIVTFFKMIRTYVTGFLTSTGIRNAQFIRQSTYGSEKAFWCIMLLVSVGITGHELTQSFEFYMKTPTSSRLKIVHNQSVSFDQATICATVHITKLNYKLDPMNASAVAELLDTLQASDEDILGFIKFSETVPSPATSRRGIQQRQLLYLTTAMISDIIRAEIQPTNDLVSNLTYWGILKWNEQTRMFVKDIRTASAMEMLQQFYFRKRVKFPDLIRAVGVGLCKRMSASIQSESWTSDRLSRSIQMLTLCEEGLIAHFGAGVYDFDDYLCLRFPNDSLRFGTDVDTKTIYIRNEDIYQWPPQNETQRIYDEVILDLSGHPSTSDVINPLRLPTGQSTRYGVKIEGHYLSVSYSRLPCSTVESRQMCNHRCRAVAIMSACNCFPLSMTLMEDAPAGVRVCGEASNESTLAGRFSSNYTRYIGGSYPISSLSGSACRRVLDLAFPNPICASKCSQQCDTQIITYGQETFPDAVSKVVFANGDHVTTVRLNMYQFAFPLIEEYFMMTFRDLASSIGGCLSLWLGASFAAVIHAIIFIIKIPFNHYVPKKQKDASQANGNCQANGDNKESDLKMTNAVQMSSRPPHNAGWQQQMIWFQNEQLRHLSQLEERIKNLEASSTTNDTITSNGITTMNYSDLGKSPRP